MKTYKIGTYKNGQQIANEVYESSDLSDIKREFERMFDATVEECQDDAMNFGWEPGTVEDTTFNEAWERKRFSEDTNNVAVFEVEEDEPLHTNYTYQGFKSKIVS
jgi:hypothetical protein